MQCPVCPRSDIPDDAAACPGCGADLMPLRRARELGLVAHNEAIRLARVGATDAALGRAAAAVALDGELAPARTVLGKLLWQAGHRRAALAQWQRAAALAPDDAEARRLLAEGRRQAARRRALVAAGGAAAALLLAGAIAAAAWLPARQLGSRVEALGERLEGELRQARAEAVAQAGALAEYRAAHTHTDSEYAEAVARAELWQQEAQAARARGEATAAELAGARDELAGIRAELAAERVRSEQLASQAAALRRQVQKLEAQLQEAAGQACPAAGEASPASGETGP